MLSRVPPGTHMCLIYAEKGTAMREITWFFAQAAKDRGVGHYFSVDCDEVALRRQMVEAGCHPVEVEDRIAFSPAEEVYTPDGRFVTDRMLKRLADTHDADRASNEGPIHYTGEMSWALKPGLEGGDLLFDYERGVNDVCACHPFSAICQYDATRFSSEQLFEVMRVHPYILVEGMVTPSPYYEYSSLAKTA